MSARCVQFKAILLKDGVEDGRMEIRRFRMDEDREKFQSLLTRTQSVFNVDTATQHCMLCWKDEDDDFVQFSTDEELRYALDNTCDDTFRFYVIVTEGAMEEEEFCEIDGAEGGVERGGAKHVTWDTGLTCTDPASVTRVTCPGVLHCGPMGKKGRKVMDRMNKMMEAAKNKEFQTVRQQVPGEFRSWVRQFVHTWYSQGAEAALTTARDKLPKDVGPDFPQWLLTFLNNHCPHSNTTAGGQDGETGMEGVKEGEMGSAPEGVPPVYFRWLCLFLPRFFWRHGQGQGQGGAAHCGKDQRHGCHRDGLERKCHKGHGKHGCHGRRGGKHGASGTSSESDTDSGEKFEKVRQQVPGEFRSWVRQFVHTWYSQGAEAALTTARDKLPKGVGPDFPQWLLTFLNNHRPHSNTTAGLGGQDGETGMEGVKEGEMGSAPESVPPVYFRWLCLFLPRFFRRHGQGQGRSGAARCGKGGRHGCHREGLEGERHQGQGEHGCHRKRASKHGASGTSSESDTDSGEKPWQQVPKEFRKYTRVTMKKLHKNKGDSAKIKEMATEAGLSSDVQAFVEQILLEWHAKMNHQPPQVVAAQMMEGERTLPSGLEHKHFLWLCRFMARWHRRHAGKCDVMSNWSSGETTTDDSSGDDFTPFGQDYRPWPRGNRCAVMNMMRGHPHGMFGRPDPRFGMHRGRGYPCFPPPCGPRFGARRCCRMNGSPEKRWC